MRHTQSEGSQSCDQLRHNSIPPNLSKATETFMYHELMSQVSPSLHPYQYGCMKGSSTTDYLVRMYHLIVEWLDRGSAIVNLLLVDYRKTFDLIRHFIAVTNVCVTVTNKHISLLLIDFLQDRFQCVYSLFLKTPTPNGLSSRVVLHKARNLVLLFLAVINFVFSEFEDKFKYVDDSSVILKYLIENSEAVPQFSDTIMSSFRD